MPFGAAYILPVSAAPLRYENKYRWIRSDGAVEQLSKICFPMHGSTGMKAATGRRAWETTDAPAGRRATSRLG